MTISLLTQAYGSLTSNSSSSINGSPSYSISSTNLSDQLLSALNALPIATQQDLVSLSSQSTNSNNQTYNAQGLLQQIQSSILSNDQLFMSDTSTNSSSTISDSLLQGLLSLPQASIETSTNAQSTQISQAPNAQNLNSNLSIALKQNPSMAPTLIQSQMNQTLMTIFNQ